MLRGLVPIATRMPARIAAMGQGGVLGFASGQ